MHLVVQRGELAGHIGLVWELQTMHVVPAWSVRVTYLQCVRGRDVPTVHRLPDG